MGDDKSCDIKINDELNNRDDKSWVIKINDELNNMSDTSAQSAQWSKRSIYRVPANCVTDLNKKAYWPQLVSIGPYHHGEENLRPMEEHKRRALLHFLKRSNKPLQTYIEALAPVVQDLKDAYDQLTDLKWHQDTEAFMELMIMDGCFILEILRTTTAGVDDQTTGSHDYAANDPIFSSHGKLYSVPYLKRDMLMLENQIPILVLEKLFAVQNDSSLESGKDLTKVILKFFSQTSVKKLEQFVECLHILDVYRKSLLQEVDHRANKMRKQSDHHHDSNQGGDEIIRSATKFTVTAIQINRSKTRCLKDISFCASKIKKQSDHHHDSNQGGDEIIRSATELTEAGIQIKKSKTKSLKDISFRGGVLKLPLIVVDDTLESQYLNLIAFERFHVGAGNEITSYIFFMDNIIDNARDVALLHSCGIIQNALGSDKEVANLFNSLSKDVTLDPKSSLDEVHKKVSHYCQRPWHRWRANLMHTYFTNPWAILSVIAAIFLFALTIIQTVYSVLGYVDPSG